MTLTSLAVLTPAALKQSVSLCRFKAGSEIDIGMHVLGDTSQPDCAAARCTQLSIFLCRFTPGSEIDIGMRVRLVDGDELISDSDADGGFQGACAKFKDWVRARYFGGSNGSAAAAVAQE